MRLSKIFWCLIPVCLFLFAAGCSDDDDSSTNPPSTTIELRAILPIEGEAAHLGAESKAAMEIAVSDIQEETGIDIHLEILDSRTDPTYTRAQIASIASTFPVVMGPMTSDAVLACCETVNAAQCVLISHSSTIPTLAEKDDHIQRLVPNDSDMAKAIAELMWHDGIRAIVSIHRADSWGTALSEKLREAFEAKGGTILGTSAYAGYRDSEYTNVLTEAATFAFGESVTFTPAEIAYHIATYGEGARIMELASERNGLEGSIRWYGSDGLVQDSTILRNATARSFALETHYTAPIFGFDGANDFVSVQTRLRTALDREPTAFAYLAYDMTTVVAHALRNLPDTPAYETINTKLHEEFDSYSGITGPITLDENGDRQEIRYDFWTISDSGTNITWTKSAIYESGTLYTP